MAIFSGYGFSPQETRSYPVVNGTFAIEEGLALTFKYPLEDGIAKVQPGSTSSSDIFAGFAYNQYRLLPSQLPKVEEFAAISALTDQVTLTHIPNTPSTAMRVVVTNPSTLAKTVLLYATTADATHFAVSGTTVTFDSSFANFSAEVVYNYTPSSIEARNFYGDAQPGINNTSVIGVINTITKGTMVITNYTTNTDWTSVAPITIAANGFVTKGGSGCVIPRAIVKQTPTASIPYLVIDLLP